MDDLLLSELDTLEEELLNLRADLKNYGERLTDYGHDCLANRIEMIESMLAMESN